MMERYDESEQWKHGGDCSKCRRDNYCSKPCTLRKRQHKRFIKNATKSILNRMTGGVMAEHIENAVEGYYMD